MSDTIPSTIEILQKKVPWVVGGWGGGGRPFEHLGLTSSCATLFPIEEDDLALSPPRVDISAFLTHVLQQHAKVLALVEANKWPDLWEADELLRELRAGRLLAGFRVRSEGRMSLLVEGVY